MADDLFKRQIGILGPRRKHAPGTRWRATARRTRATSGLFSASPHLRPMRGWPAIDVLRRIKTKRVWILAIRKLRVPGASCRRHSGSVALIEERRALSPSVQNTAFGPLATMSYFSISPHSERCRSRLRARTRHACNERTFDLPRTRSTPSSLTIWQRATLPFAAKS